MYTRILDLFVADEDSHLEWATKPFLNTVDYNVWATDGHAVVIIPTDLCGNGYESLEKKLTMPTELKPDQWLHLNADQIRQAVEKIHKEEIMEVKKVKCKECDGEGTVLWEYEASTNNEEYEHEYECPVCEGDGYVYEEVGSGKFEPSHEIGIGLGEATFSAWQLNRILKTMFILGVDALDIASTPHKTRATLFRLGDIRIIQMPMLSEPEIKLEPNN